MKARQGRAHDGFGVPPARVLQSSYEPIQYDETGALCGSQPTLGLDVHPGFEAQQGSACRRPPDFLRDFPRAARMHRRHQAKASCPANLRPAPAPASRW